MPRHVLFLGYVLAATLVASFGYTTASLIGQLNEWRAWYKRAHLELTWPSVAPFIEHHRFLSTLEDYVFEGRAAVSKDELIERFDIYWSRLPTLAEEVSVLFHADDIALEDLAETTLARLKEAEPLVFAIDVGDTQQYWVLRNLLEENDKPFIHLYVNAFEQKRALAAQQMEFDQSLNGRIRFAVTGLMVASMLLLGLFMWQLQQKTKAQAALSSANDNLLARINEGEILAARLSYQATHDEQTGLLNRRAFESALESGLENVNETSPLGILFLDLDQFKIVNDTCGHAAGDELLIQVSELLKGRLSEDDVIARFGGDEFAILQRCGSRASLRASASTIRDAFDVFRYQRGGKSFNVNASIGVVFVESADLNAESLMANADTACYVAKDAGGHRIHYYRHDDDAIKQRHEEMNWTSRITTALRDDRFCLFHQSIVPVSTTSSQGRIYELLVRMVAPNGDLIPPGAFLSTAERYRLSSKIDRWVVRSALEWLSTQRESWDRLEFVALNLSGHSIGDAETLESIEQWFEKFQVPPHKVCFEVTETAAMGPSALPFLSALKRQGCRLALDDFGSGLCSFAYLKDLPVEYLKIDGMFVKDIDTNPVHLELVRSINDIGHVMQKQTIAEFVESEAIMECLVTLGVDYAQGFYIGKPMPMKDLEVQNLNQVLSHTSAA